MENERYLIKKIKKIIENCIYSLLIITSLTFTMGFYSDRSMFVRLNDLEIELGDKLPSDITNYVSVVTDKSYFTIESNVPVDEDGYTSLVGEYTYYLAYNDITYRYTKKAYGDTAKITVVDTKKPLIKVNDNVKIPYKGTLKVSEIATCIDHAECELKIVEDIDTTKSGEYEITIEAVDASGNKNETKAKIEVQEKPIKYYTKKNFSYIDEHNNSLNADLTEEEKDELRNQIVAFAKQFVGNPYVYGGTSLTNGTDCSGFTMQVYAHFGYKLPRVSPDQGSVGKRVSASSLLPGDIIVYYYSNGNGHVGIYDGNGKIIHASTPERGIMYENVYDGYKVYQRIIY